MLYEYKNGLLPAGRIPRLYLAKGGEVVEFEGANIPGFCAITTSKFEKCGKWSNTIYRLDLVPGVRPLHFVSPMHGVWGDNLGSWGEVAEELELPVEVARRIIRDEYGATAERLDKLEEFALAVEAQGATTETVIISFGSPSNRSIANGYWENPKSSQTSDGRVVTVEPGKDEYGASWGKPLIVTPEGAKIISSKHRPGMHGGYWTIEVVVPIK